MVPVRMMQEILDLKAKGFSVNEIFDYPGSGGSKPPTKRTILKYYNMDSFPDNPGAALEKEKAFDREPFKDAILKAMKNIPRDCCVSSVYDVLMEKFVESGEFDSLPGNQQTLRNYIHHLRETGQIPAEDNSGKRTYEFVMDTPPGDQMLIDFGEVKTEGGNGKIHFICLLLRCRPLRPCTGSQIQFQGGLQGNLLVFLQDWRETQDTGHRPGCCVHPFGNIRRDCGDRDVQTVLSGTGTDALGLQQGRSGEQGPDRELGQVREDKLLQCQKDNMSRRCPEVTSRLAGKAEQKDPPVHFHGSEGCLR